MDPLSISASAAGLLGAIVSISKTLKYVSSSIVNVPRTISSLITEIDETQVAVSVLYQMIQKINQLPKRCTSFVSIEQLMATLTEAVLTISQIEGLVEDLVKDDISLFERVVFAFTTTETKALVERLQRNKSSLNLMFNILNCESNDEILSLSKSLAMHTRLMLESNPDLRRRLDAAENHVASQWHTSSTGYEDIRTLREEDGATIRSTMDKASSSTKAPGKIYPELVSDILPEPLLTPDALHSILIKVRSAHLKQSQHNGTEKDLVFTLEVTTRSNAEQLWRVEKSVPALLQLIEELRLAGLKTLNRSLILGHKLVKFDTKWEKLEIYLQEMLDMPRNQESGLIICQFLSTQVIPVRFYDGSTKEGFLTKRGKNSGSWKLQYFVLTKQTTRYYEEGRYSAFDEPILSHYASPGGPLLDQIKLIHAKIVRQPGQNTVSQVSKQGEENKNAHRHALLILEPKKDSKSHFQHVLCAESDKERDEWLTTLLQYLEQSRKPKSRIASFQSEEKPFNLSFETVLEESRVYKRVFSDECDVSFRTSIVRSHVMSIFSSLSLSDVSAISVVALPIYAKDLSNPHWYEFGNYKDGGSSISHGKIDSTVNGIRQRSGYKPKSPRR